MNTDECRPEDNDLRVAVACLEMEISDSVLDDLLTAITDRYQDESNGYAASLLLQNMDTVARHIDSLRVKSSLRAFSLINELWDAYAETANGQEKEQARQSALDLTREVLGWQQQCLVDLTNRTPAPQPSRTPKPSPALGELLQEQITETSSLIRVEMAALKELARDASGSTVKEQVTAAVAKQAEDLQEFMRGEINSLRRELQPDSESA